VQLASKLLASAITEMGRDLRIVYIVVPHLSHDGTRATSAAYSTVGQTGPQRPQG
jgi:hypothetical protein